MGLPPASRLAPKASPKNRCRPASSGTRWRRRTEGSLGGLAHRPSPSSAARADGHAPLL